MIFGCWVLSKNTERAGFYTHRWVGTLCTYLRTNLPRHRIVLKSMSRVGQNRHIGSKLATFFSCRRHFGDMSPLSYLRYWKNSSNTCFFRKRDCTASWVIDVIWQQHLEESKVPNPNFCRFLFTEQHLIFY